MAPKKKVTGLLGLGLDHAELDVGVALVDVEGSPSVPEFRIICRALEEAGFEEVDCPYKNHRFAVYGGRKPRKTVPIDTRAYDGEDSTDG